jgi:uncharacterized membrane protein YgcG
MKDQWQDRWKDRLIPVGSALLRGVSALGRWVRSWIWRRSHELPWEEPIGGGTRTFGLLDLFRWLMVGGLAIVAWAMFSIEAPWAFLCMAGATALAMPSCDRFFRRRIPLLQSGWVRAVLGLVLFFKAPGLAVASQPSLQEIALCDRLEAGLCVEPRSAFRKATPALYLTGKSQNIKEGDDLELKLDYTSEPKRTSVVAMKTLKAKVTNNQLLLELRTPNLSTGFYEVTLSIPGKKTVSEQKLFTIWDTPPPLSPTLSDPLSNTSSVVSELRMCSPLEQAIDRSPAQNWIGEDLTSSISLMNDERTTEHPAVLVGGFEVAKRRGRRSHSGGDSSSGSHGDGSSSSGSSSSGSHSNPDRSNSFTTSPSTTSPSMVPDGRSNGICPKNMDTFTSSNRTIAFSLYLTPNVMEDQSIQIIWKSLRDDKEVIVRESSVVLDKGLSLLNHRLNLGEGLPAGNYELLLLPKTRHGVPIARRFQIK